MAAAPGKDKPWCLWRASPVDNAALTVPKNHHHELPLQQEGPPLPSPIHPLRGQEQTMSRFTPIRRRDGQLTAAEYTDLYLQVTRTNIVNLHNESDRTVRSLDPLPILN